MDYRELTIWELEQEKAKIEVELKRRRWLGCAIIIDPTMPPNEVEIVQGPHRIRITSIEGKP